MFLKKIEYAGSNFALTLPEKWRDQTVHVLRGPVVQDMQHQLTVNVDPESGFERLIDYVDWQVRAMEEALRGLTVLRKDAVRLDNGLPGYRVTSLWHPIEDRRLYQENLFVLHEGKGYRLAAMFSKKTRQTLGPIVERMLMGFEPTRPEPANQRR